MNHEFLDALEQLEKEKGVSKEILLDAVETALASAYKRDQKVAQSIEVRIDSTTGALHVYTHKTVVDEVEDDKNEISLTDALKINSIYELGDLVEFEIFPKEFGRIAAQTAKQVVVQRIREAERSIIYEEFIGRVSDLITGIVHRFEQRNIFVDLGRIEGILPGNEQIPNEKYEQGARIKAFVVEVKKTTKGPQVLLSRTRPGFLKRLFELEVPEIQDGLIEIKSVSREPGYRSKVAVYSKDAQIDPVGACVGARGIRVQMIVRELKGEKIDVVPWSTDPVEFIINALSPAKVAEVKILESKKTAIVIVPDFQLSLAIGREGQNARLAAKLTGWKIDIKSESQAAKEAENIQSLINEELELMQPKPPVGENVLESAAVPVVNEDESEEDLKDLEDLTQPSIEVTELTTEAAYSEEKLLEEEVTDEADDSDEADYDQDEEDFLDEPGEVEKEEKVFAKKKPKKSKMAKHLTKIEYEADVNDAEQEYFFTEASNNEVELEKNNDALNSKENSDGFTIGQLLGGKIAKVKKDEESNEEDE